MPDDLAMLASSGEVEVVTTFPDGGSFTYRLRRGNGADVTFSDGVLCVELEASVCEALQGGVTEGVYHEAALAGGGSLQFYVERDRGGRSHPPIVSKRVGETPHAD
jgi:hypothetical protein